MESIYARAGSAMRTETEYDFTQEYFSRLKGVDYIPVRKSSDYHERPGKAYRRNYLTPRMKQMNKSRLKAQEIKS